jgi:enamine deaminase RidA (YjgF/YER057c/UK114 family)
MLTDKDNRHRRRPRGIRHRVRLVTGAGLSAAGAEQRLQDHGLTLPTPPTPYGAYVEAVKVGNMLYLSGMLPVVERKPQFIGRVGGELSAEQGHEAARIACLNGLSAARAFLGTLDKVTAVVKLGVYIATAGDFRDHPKVADGASEILVDVFGTGMLSGRIVLGVASLPLGLPVEVELVFEVAP